MNRYEASLNWGKTALASETNQSGKITKRKLMLFRKIFRINKWIARDEGSIMEAVTDAEKKNTGENLGSYHNSSLRNEAANVVQALRLAFRHRL